MSETAATFPIPPSAFNLPFGEVRDGGVFLTPSSMQFLQLIWAAIQGKGGLVDQFSSTIGLAQQNSDVRHRIDQAALLPAGRVDARAHEAITGAVRLAQRPSSPPRPASLPPMPAPRPRYLDPPVSTFARLPPTPTVGSRAFITDGSVAAAGNFGAAAAGSGTNAVPVYWDGAAWRIG